MSARILVKAVLPQTRSMQFSLGSGEQVRIEPLFTSRRLKAFAAANRPDWFVMHIKEDGAANAWDYCHRLTQTGFGIRGAGAPVFAEPDLDQQWIAGSPSQWALALTASCMQPEPPFTGKGIPNGDSKYWFREANYSELEKARDSVGIPSTADRIRIAHFDTGYDPEHKVLPPFFRTDLARNFVDGENPESAIDQSSGLMNNLGHGTGTLGILAGKTLDGELLGGAANLEVVPVRVANSVILFKNSAIARALDYVIELYSQPAKRVHVITMSMGGLASQAWAEAVNLLYDLGIFIVTAAGNNFSNKPTRHIVFPARFNRVMAACGVMADGRPYADLPFGVMAGNYGPDHKMGTAMAAYTPNTPWARFGCKDTIDLNGRGTSSATPQIAAAAALWIQQNKTKLDKYAEGWMKVEAVRWALFESADLPLASLRERLGRGILRAAKALKQAPPAQSVLIGLKQAEDSASFPFLRVITGLGVKEAPVSHAMFELEALQLSERSAILEDLISQRHPDPRRIAEALIADPNASDALREMLEKRSTQALRPQVAAKPSAATDVQSRVARAMAPVVPPPEYRKLRVYAADPLMGTRLDTHALNMAAIDVRWETDLRPGPVGEYLELVDVDPSSDCTYAPVDLNDPSVLAQSGLKPSESNPFFHQQMVYAVAMKTIRHFEDALGRSALWSAKIRKRGNRSSEQYIRRLRVYPHALREANAYYSPEKKALLFGYFPASDSDSGDNPPGSVVFSCLSHDIIAHETTHALLDGLHSRFQEPTNPDVLAFHEGFADIVALFQHFTLPEALMFAIAKTQGDLRRQNMLGELAQQFGQAIGKYGALRSAIGEINPATHVWEPATPARSDYQNATEPHDRGAVLVAAVFDAFLEIYRARGADLIRLATGGTGVLPPGDIPVDLVRRLAKEASKTASHVLNICIRALDYCPPVDITFGEYLRALITADRDLVPTDPMGYRVAFIQAFRRRGIYPPGVRHLSSDSLCWETPDVRVNFRPIVARMELGWNLNANRGEAFKTSQRNRRRLNAWIRSLSRVSSNDADAFGIIPARGRYKVNGVAGELSAVDVHSVRPLRRIGPDGQQRTDLIVEMTQSWTPDGQDQEFSGGCTVIADLESDQIKYCVRKRAAHPDRIKAQQEFVRRMRSSALRTKEPFALLHRGL